MTRLEEEAPANSVPAAAVRRGGQVLFGMTRRKGHVGGESSWKWKSPAQLAECFQNQFTRVRYRGKRNFVCSDKMQKYTKERQKRRQLSGSLTDAKVRKHGERTGLDTLVVHAVNDECSFLVYWYCTLSVRLKLGLMLKLLQR